MNMKAENIKLFNRLFEGHIFLATVTDYDAPLVEIQRLEATTPDGTKWQKLAGYASPQVADVVLCVDLSTDGRSEVIVLDALG